MEFLAGLMLIVFGIGGFVYKYLTAADITTNVILQSVVAGFGGLYIVYPYLKAKLSEFKNNTKKIDNEFETGHDHSCEQEMSDFKALHYLKDRAVEMKSQEALDLLVKLNTIMFSSSNTKV